MEVAAPQFGESLFSRILQVVGSFIINHHGQDLSSLHIVYILGQPSALVLAPVRVEPVHTRQRKSGSQRWITAQSRRITEANKHTLRLWAWMIVWRRWFNNRHCFLWWQIDAVHTPAKLPTWKRLLFWQSICNYFSNSEPTISRFLNDVRTLIHHETRTRPFKATNLETKARQEVSHVALTYQNAAPLQFWGWWCGWWPLCCPSSSRSDNSSHCLAQDGASCSETSTTASFARGLPTILQFRRQCTFGQNNCARHHCHLTCSE